MISKDEVISKLAAKYNLDIQTIQFCVESYWKQIREVMLSFDVFNMTDEELEAVPKIKMCRFGNLKLNIKRVKNAKERVHKTENDKTDIQ